MADLTSSRNTDRLSDQTLAPYGPIIYLKSGQTIYGGSLVFVDTSTGYAYASTGATRVCMGWNDGGDIGPATSDSSHSIIPRRGPIPLVNSGTSALSNINRGTLCYAEDNQTARAASGAYAPLGTFIGLDDASTPRAIVDVGTGPLFSVANLQPLDADLTAIAALDATAGLLAKTAANTYARRTVSSGGDGISIANGDGQAGNPAISLANDVAALEALDATAGLLAKTAAETYARRTVSSGGDGISIANGDGQAGNPAISLANDVAAFEALDATGGLLAKTAAETYARRTVSSGGDGISVANGDGVAGNPAISLANDVAALEALDATAGLLAKTGAEAYSRRTVTAGSTALAVTNGDGQAGNPTVDGSTAVKNLSALAGTGLLVQSGGAADAGTFVERSVVSGGDGISVANGDGVAGNPAISLANDVAALEALDATAGLLAKTAAETYARRTVSSGGDGISVANGDGQAGNPAISLANDVAALEALDATAGLLAKTGAEAYARRTVTSGDSSVSIADGDGASGNPTISNYGCCISLADPGDGVAIPVTRSATVPLVVGAGAETNTLAIPTFLGQSMRLVCNAVAGGTRAVTAASAINIAGNTTMTFNAARDYIVLHAISLGGALAWEVTDNNNVALS